MDYIIQGIVDGIVHTSALEWIAVITGVMSVWFSMKENILVYPTGIISVLIYVYLTFQYKIYADMGVNAYYFVVSVYGWYYWTHTGSAEVKQVPVTINNKSENWITGGIFLCSLGILFFILHNFTDSDIAFWDALTTAFAISGMWLMARKKLENWIAWIITDLISIPLYFYKGLILTSFQFLFFTALAFAGYFAWKKSYQKTQNTAEA